MIAVFNNTQSTKMIQHVDSDVDLYNYDEPEIDLSDSKRIISTSDDDGDLSVTSDLSNQSGDGIGPMMDNDFIPFEGIKAWEMGNLLEAADLTHGTNFGDFAAMTHQIQHTTDILGVGELVGNNDNMHQQATETVTHHSSIIEQLQALGAIVTETRPDPNTSDGGDSKAAVTTTSSTHQHIVGPHDNAPTKDNTSRRRPSASGVTYKTEPSTTSKRSNVSKADSLIKKMTSRMKVLKRFLGVRSNRQRTK